MNAPSAAHQTPRMPLFSFETLPEGEGQNSNPLGIFAKRSDGRFGMILLVKTTPSFLNQTGTTRGRRDGQAHDRILHGSHEANKPRLHHQAQPLGLQPRRHLLRQGQQSQDFPLLQSLSRICRINSCATMSVISLRFRRGLQCAAADDRASLWGSSLRLLSLCHGSRSHRS